MQDHILQEGNLAQERYTPPYVLDSVREYFLDGDDKEVSTFITDPCTTEKLNNLGLQARFIHDRESDGLSRPWYGHVFLNPPGGVLEGTKKSLSKVWFDYLLDQIEKRNTLKALYLGFNIETLRICPEILQSESIIWGVFKKRLKFWSFHLDGEFREGVLCVNNKGEHYVSNTPAHSNIMALVLNRTSSPLTISREKQKFYKHFSSLLHISS